MRGVSATEAPEASERARSTERGAPAAAAEATRAIYDNTPYVILVAIYVVAGVFVLRAVGHDIPYMFTDIYRQPLLLTVMYLGVVLLIAIGRDVFVARRRPGDPTTWHHLYRRWFGTRRMVGMLIVLATLPALLDVMLGHRQALTDFKPFAYDVEFMRWDRWLHFGQHPWELLQPLLGHPAVTVFLDRSYVYGWFALMWLGTIWQAVHGREPIRLQFFLSFAGCWILLGTISAILLSSAGPVYFGRVTDLEDPYVPLMTYLASVDMQTSLNALANQERLWLTYRTWGGITAMPSMHLAIATVVSLAAYRSHRWLGLIVGPVWLLMLLGSVHLGWHYAIDSYAGVLGAVAIWYMCGRGARWWIGRRDESPAGRGDVA